MKKDSRKSPGFCQVWVGRDLGAHLIGTFPRPGLAELSFRTPWNPDQALFINLVFPFAQLPALGELGMSPALGASGAAQPSDKFQLCGFPRGWGFH